MKIFKQTSTYHSVVIDITCDICGGTCKNGNRFELASIRGLFTDKKLSAHICYKCTSAKLFPLINFKIETWEIPILTDTPINNKT